MLWASTIRGIEGQLALSLVLGPCLHPKIACCMSKCPAELVTCMGCCWCSMHSQHTYTVTIDWI